MDQDNFAVIITDQTKRALWEVQNVMDCIPDHLWEKPYCEIPMWKHVYHMLHSMDLWFINPRDPNYQEPSFHTEGLNNLNAASSGKLSRTQLNDYLCTIQKK